MKISCFMQVCGYMQFGLLHTLAYLHSRDESAYLFHMPMHQLLVIAKLIGACQEVYISTVEHPKLVICIEKNDSSPNFSYQQHLATNVNQLNLSGPSREGYWIQL